MKKAIRLILSDAMRTAYTTTKTMGEAVEWVLSAYRDADKDTLEDMWAAIDTYEYINGR